MRATTKLRSLLAAGRTIVAPGAFDGLSARLVENAGFPAAYAGGGAIARSHAIPDLGLLSLSDIAHRIASIVDAVSIPVIADADNGYGNALNAERMAAAFVRAGVAALHIEDQTYPKRCGHYDNKTLVSVDEMVGKLKAVRARIEDPDFVLIARTDAIAVEGFARAIERCRAYKAAGADVAFLDAPTSEAEIREIARLLPGWKLINMFHGGKTPLLPVSLLEEIGFAIVIIPSDTQRAAIRAMQRTLATIARDGSSAACIPDMATFDEREELVGTPAFLERGRRYGG